MSNAVNAWLVIEHFYSVIPLCVDLSLSDLTVKSSSSGRVSLRWRLERARGGVEGGSRNSLSSWSVLTTQRTSPTKAWASLAVIALENPRPCRGRSTVMLCHDSTMWDRINYCIYTCITWWAFNEQSWNYLMSIFKSVFISNGWKAWSSSSVFHYAWLLHVIWKIKIEFTDSTILSNSRLSSSQSYSPGFATCYTILQHTSVSTDKLSITLMQSGIEERGKLA